MIKEPDEVVKLIDEDLDNCFTYTNDGVSRKLILELVGELKTAREMCEMSFINNRVVTKKKIYWWEK